MADSTRCLQATSYKLQARSAFTLIEVMVVMAIMAVVMGVSVYQFRKGEARQDLRTAADDIKAAWAEMQARALAYAQTPPGTVLVGTTLSAVGSFSPVYGLMLYGTQFAALPQSYHFSYTFGRFMPGEESNTDDDSPIMLPGQQVIDQPFVLLGCSGLHWSMFCRAELPGYAPVLPPNTYIDRASIQLAPSTTNASGQYAFFNFLANSGDPFAFRDAIDYERCVPDLWSRYQGFHEVGNPAYTEMPPDKVMARYLFIAAMPPRPDYTINGFSGCGAVRFALRSTLDEALLDNQRARLWLQFDMRTGRISTANSEIGLPSKP